AAGYHGGLTPQELLVPIAVFSKSVDALEGWRHAQGTLPDWWEPKTPIDTPPETSTDARPESPKRRPRRSENAGQAKLFPSSPSESVEPANRVVGQRQDSDESADRWSALFTSEMWQSQTSGLTMAVPEVRVRRVLDLLTDHGGRLSLEAACRALNIGQPRLRSTVTQLQRLLNVDAYAIFDLDEAAGELRLDRGLLDEQFEL
ncbi:MAG: hypothetical protein AAFY88_31920, partial [Acidobacteriota bacterium]